MSCISTFLTHPVLARSLYSSMFLKSPTIYGVSEGKRKVFEEAGRERTLVLKFFHRNSFLKQFYNIPNPVTHFTFTLKYLRLSPLPAGISVTIQSHYSCLGYDWIHSMSVVIFLFLFLSG